MFSQVSVCPQGGGNLPDRNPRTETPQTETPLDRICPGQRPPWTETPWIETPRQRPIPPPYSKQRTVRILLECIPGFGLLGFKGCSHGAIATAILYPIQPISCDNSSAHSPGFGGFLKFRVYVVCRSNDPNNFSLFTFVFLQVLLRTKDHYCCLMLWLIWRKNL